MIRESYAYNAKHRNNIRERVAKETRFSSNAKRGAGPFAKTTVAFAAFLVCLLIATPALAVGVPQAYSLLYAVSPQMAQLFKPVQRSSLDQGIEVTVVEAYVHDETAEAIISVCDTTQNRLDDSLDLYDSYEFHTGFDSTGTCKQIGYDDATKTAYFQLSISSMNPNDRILGSKITFSLKTLLCGKKETLDKPITIDWKSIPESVKTESAEPYEGTVLVPGDDQMEPESGFYLSGIGYVDGKLHIQLFTPWRSVYDDHAFLYLLDAKGNRVNADMRYRGSGYSDNAESEGREDYIDYEFPVPQSELTQYKLYGEFYSYKTRIDGNWSITFPMENDVE